MGGGGGGRGGGDEDGEKKNIRLFLHTSLQPEVAQAELLRFAAYESPEDLALTYGYFSAVMLQVVSRRAFCRYVTKCRCTN